MTPSEFRKETVEEFLARGGSIQRVEVAVQGFELSEASETPAVEPDCVCCGRASGHRHWCIFHPSATDPMDEDETPDESPDCPTCRKRKKTCAKCILAIRAKSALKLCLICGEEFSPTSRFGRFVCNTCK